jgi:glycine cleavage system H protein
MEFPANLRYTKEHEWARQEGNRIVVGITDFAQKELGDVVFVELPKVGTTVAAMDTFGVVESVKAVSDMYAPVSGTVVDANIVLEDQPELVNASPYGQGWMAVIEAAHVEELQQLLTAAEYQAYVAQEKSSR